MRKLIENTKTFKALSFIQQKIYSKSTCIKEIEHQFIVAKNKGVVQWENDCKPLPVYKNIIEELLKV